MTHDRYLTHSDAGVIGRLAEEIMRTEDRHEVGGKLAAVLSSATILPQGEHKPDYVTLYAKVGYSRVTQFEKKNVLIVRPCEANRHLSFVSILSPIGLALIGMKIDGVVRVSMPLGYIEYLKVISIEHYRNADVW